MGKQERAKSGKYCFEDSDEGQSGHQHFKSREPAMHQDFVDHDLEYERRCQREELNYERCDQDFVENSAVFADRTPKPGNIEAPTSVVERRAFGNQNKPPVPVALECVEGQQLRCRVIVTLEKDAL